jgi:hypothetical protein
MAKKSLTDHAGQQLADARAALEKADAAVAAAGTKKDKLRNSDDRNAWRDARDDYQMATERQADARNAFNAAQASFTAAARDARRAADRAGMQSAIDDKQQQATDGAALGAQLQAVLDQITQMLELGERAHEASVAAIRASTQGHEQLFDTLLAAGQEARGTNAIAQAIGSFLIALDNLMAPHGAGLRGHVGVHGVLPDWSPELLGQSLDVEAQRVARRLRSYVGGDDV